MVSESPENQSGEKQRQHRYRKSLYPLHSFRVRYQISLSSFRSSFNHAAAPPRDAAFFRPHSLQGGNYFYLNHCAARQRFNTDR